MKKIFLTAVVLFSLATPVLAQVGPLIPPPPEEAIFTYQCDDAVNQATSFANIGMILVVIISIIFYMMRARTTHMTFFFLLFAVFLAGCIVYAAAFALNKNLMLNTLPNCENYPTVPILMIPRAASLWTAITGVALLVTSLLKARVSKKMSFQNINNNKPRS